MEPPEIPLEGRLARWMAQTIGQPPETLANHIASPTASWVVVTTDGPEIDPQRHTAYLDEEADLPCWAYVLAKSFLDDVGEWPVFGMAADNALANWEDHQDASRAVREILATVQPVWPEVTMLYVGKKQG